MRFIIVVAAAMLSGCMYQSVNQNDIQTAIKACGSLENVNYINPWWHGSEWAGCTNRQHIQLDERVWTK